MEEDKIDNQHSTSEDNIEIADYENYRSDKDFVYSHQSLVMIAKRRVLEVGGHELIDGFYESIKDSVTGKTKVVYREDTKRAFINAVRMCKAVMACDFTPEFRKKIETLLKSIEDKKKEVLKQQEVAWTNAPLQQKLKSGITGFHPSYFYKELPFYAEFLQFELETYFQIFEELNNLAKELDFYSAEIFEN